MLPLIIDAIKRAGNKTRAKFISRQFSILRLIVGKRKLRLSLVNCKHFSFEVIFFSDIIGVALRRNTSEERKEEIHAPFCLLWNQFSPLDETHVLRRIKFSPFFSFFFFFFFFLFWFVALTQEPVSWNEDRKRWVFFCSKRAECTRLGNAS